MKGFGILAAAAILASALASPALAQEVVSNPGYCAQFYPNANCQTKGPGNPYTGGYQRQVYGDRVYQDPAYRGRAWRDSYGATGMAGAMASPTGGDEYARRNGFVCIPGTWFRGADGRMHICQ